MNAMSAIGFIYICLGHTLYSAALPLDVLDDCESGLCEADFSQSSHLSLLQNRVSVNPAVAPVVSKKKDVSRLLSLQKSATKIDYGHPSWLESCKTIYLDVGSNIGVQVRKLWEPRLYPGAPMLPLFDHLFGLPSTRCAPSSQSGICALGFEPNPTQRPHLTKIEQAYEKNGWNVHFYPFAAAHDDGSAVFAFDESSEHEDWGAHIQDEDMENRNNVTYDNVNVTMIDFGAFVEALGPHKVKMMKMDIEGAEWEALASMEEHKVLCSGWVENAFIETHPGGDTTHWEDNRTIASLYRRISSQECGAIRVIPFDDESYLHDQPVPPGQASNCDVAGALASNSTGIPPAV